MGVPSPETECDHRSPKSTRSHVTMNQFQKVVLGLCVVMLLLVAWLMRFSVVVGSRGDATPPAYKLDRWTGDVTLIFGATERPVGPPVSP